MPFQFGGRCHRRAGLLVAAVALVLVGVAANAPRAAAELELVRQFGNNQIELSRGIDVGGDGRVYVANTDAVLIFNTQGVLSKRLPVQRYHGDTVSDVAVGDDAIYVILSASDDDLVWKYDFSGHLLTSWTIPWEDFASGLDVGPSGDVYVAVDFGFRQFTSEGAPVREVHHPDYAGAGVGSDWVDTVAVDGSGTVFISESGGDDDGGDIRRFSASGQPLNSWIVAGGPGGNHPLDVDAAGNLWTFGETRNVPHVLHKYSPTGALLERVGAGSESKIYFSDPVGIATGSQGRVFVLTEDAVLELAPPPPSPPPPDDLLVRKLRAKGKRIKMNVNCPIATGCYGTLEIGGKVNRKLIGGGGGKRNIEFIRKKSYSIGGGTKQNLKLTLTPLARKALDKKRKLSGIGTLTATSGAQVQFRAILIG